MAVHLSWPNFPMVFKTQIIVLDTRELVLDFIWTIFQNSTVFEDRGIFDRCLEKTLGTDQFIVDTYIEKILEDITQLDDALGELAYRSYEMMDVGDGIVSEAYDNLGRLVYQQLQDAGAYAGNILQYRFQRLLSHDIVLVRTDFRE